MLKLVKDADNNDVEDQEAMLRLQVSQMMLPLLLGTHSLIILMNERPDLFAAHKETLAVMAASLKDATEYLSV